MLLELAAYLGGGGDTVDWLLGLPVPSFTSAYESYKRVYLRQFKERLYSNYVGAQGTQDSVGKYASLIEHGDADHAPATRGSNDASKFVQKFGKKLSKRGRK